MKSRQPVGHRASPLSGTPSVLRRPAPALSEHEEEIMAMLKQRTAPNTLGKETGA